MDGAQQLEYQKQTRNDQVSKVIEDDADDLETHFVENPFIKMRERASQKDRDSKVMMGQTELEQDSAMKEAKTDIYIMKESGKMIVNDLEKDAVTKEAQQARRKKEGYGVNSDTDSDEEAGSSLVKKGQNSRAMRSTLRQQNLQKRSSSSSAIHKPKSSLQRMRANQQLGHFEKFSGDTYKSTKGKGDVLKAGKLEPFSYIQLNPRLLNKRNKQHAINSFTKVVSFGKKLDKRGDKTKTSSGMLSGIQKSPARK